MAKVKVTNSQDSQLREAPALAPESRENQMIALAERCAEKQLLDGTASSQVITHYLKLGSLKARKELKLLDAEIELAHAKAENQKSQKRQEELYAEALKAMRNYNGQGDPDEY